MTLGEVLAIIEGEAISEDTDLRQQVTAGCAADLASDILRSSREGTLLISGLTTPQVVRTAHMVDLQAILFVRGKRPLPETIALADEMHISLLASRHAMFEVCGRLFQAGLPSCRADAIAPHPCSDATRADSAGRPGQP